MFMRGEKRGGGVKAMRNSEALGECMIGFTTDAGCPSTVEGWGSRTRGRLKIWEWAWRQSRLSERRHKRSLSECSAVVFQCQIVPRPCCFPTPSICIWFPFKSKDVTNLQSAAALITYSMQFFTLFFCELKCYHINQWVALPLISCFQAAPCGNHWRTWCFPHGPSLELLVVESTPKHNQFSPTRYSSKIVDRIMQFLSNF